MRAVRRLPWVEFAVVVLVTLLVTSFTLWAGLVHRLAILDGNPNGYDLADLGPGLLVLSCGLSVVTYRRWRDSERKCVRLDATTDDLLKSEDRYRSLVEVSPDPVLVVRDLDIVYVNPAAVAFFGAATIGDLIGRSILDLLPADLGEGAPSWIEAVLASGEPAAPFEHPLLRLDGVMVEAETALVRTPYEGGFALQAVVRDVSARHATDAAVTRYETLAESTEEIVYFVAPDGRILDCNRAAVLCTGYTADELRSMTVYDLRAPGSTTPASVDVTHVPGDTAHFDSVHARKDGTLLELGITAQRVAIGNEEVVVAVCRDVTETRRAVRELRDSEARYRNLIELSPSPIVVQDAEGFIVFANAATLDLLGAHVPSDVIGHQADDFVHPDSRPAGRRARELREREGSSPFLDTTLVRVDGTSVATQMATSRTTYDTGDAVQIVMQDVSRLQDAAETLRRTAEDTISAMARLAETRDPYTTGHQERVAAIALRIAGRMGLTHSVCENIRLAGIVHDIGKIGVPAEILSKPGNLTDAEYALIQDHARRGYELLLPIDFPWPIAEIVRQHHERLDGSGYPRGLEGGDICVEARVIAVADTVEAISADRPYRLALGLECALDVIRAGRGTLFDADCVDAALELADESALLGLAASELDAALSA